MDKVKSLYSFQPQLPLPQFLSPTQFPRNVKNVDICIFHGIRSAMGCITRARYFLMNFQIRILHSGVASKVLNISVPDSQSRTIDSERSSRPCKRCFPRPILLDFLFFQIDFFVEVVDSRNNSHVQHLEVWKTLAVN